MRSQRKRFMDENEEGANRTKERLEQKKPYETPALTEYGKIAELTRGTGTLHTVDTLGLSV
jgi:hypothetical protein